QLGTQQLPEAIIASVAVSDGRVYVVSDANLYAIGKKSKSPAVAISPSIASAAGSAVTHVQVVPTELMLRPGSNAKFRVRLFDNLGLLIREEPAAAASWSLE
ncbi:MAG: PQQ-binding-like beta-propeller repeat protein, partial [Pyrinomonadaceae bacterium]